MISNDKASLEIIEAGVQSSLQDWGRYGHAHLGGATAGPLDEHAFLWTHKLLGNKARSAAIEISFGNFSVRAHAACRIALCGADMQWLLNKKPIANWQTHYLSAGDILSSSFAQNGMRAYLAVQGQFLLDYQGSVSAVPRDQLGGLHGNGIYLKAGDKIPFQVNNQFTDNEFGEQRVPAQYQKAYQDDIVYCDLFTIYQHVEFSDEQKQHVEQTCFRISAKSDRMGLRLEGESIPLVDTIAQIPSEGIALGSVQIPASGLPIIMLRDRQRIGGYPKLGVVTRQSLNKLAQARPGQKIQFRFLATPAAQQKVINELSDFYDFFRMK